MERFAQVGMKTLVCELKRSSAAGNCEAWWKLRLGVWGKTDF